MHIKSAQNILILICILQFPVGCDKGVESRSDQSGGDTSVTRSYASPDALIKKSAIDEWGNVNGVSINLDYYEDKETNPLLAVTFHPQDGFHLYGKNLDTEKTGGLGRPTKTKIKSSDNSIKIAGDFMESVTADEKPNETLGVSVPVYPEGPVTIYIPVELNPSESEITGSVQVSYMACKDDGVCLPPVSDRELPFTMSVNGVAETNRGDGDGGLNE